MACNIPGYLARLLFIPAIPCSSPLIVPQLRMTLGFLPFLVAFGCLPDTVPAVAGGEWVNRLKGWEPHEDNNVMAKTNI